MIQSACYHKIDQKFLELIQQKFIWLCDIDLFMLKNKYGCMFIKLPSLQSSIFSDNIVLDRYEYDYSILSISKNHALNQLIQSEMSSTHFEQNDQLIDEIVQLS